MRYCHDNNVVHRDLKTENILKLKDGSRVALVDFGMSHIWEQKQNEEEEEEEEKETKSDNEKKKEKKSKQDKLRKAMGTHLYFAPEIVKKGTPASPAIARARSVLPVPGGPTSKAPLGILAPNL